MRVTAALLISAVLASFEAIDAQELSPSTPVCYALELAFTDVWIEGTEDPTAAASAKPIECATLIGQ